MIGVFLTIFYFLSGFYLIGKLRVFRDSGLSIRFLRSVFVLKCFAGFVLLFMYNGRYEDRDKADVYKFFDDSAVLSNVLTENPGLYLEIMTGVDMNDPVKMEVFDRMNNWFRGYDEGYTNDNHFMIRLNGWLRLISLGSIHVHSVILNFVWLLAAILFISTLSVGIESTRWILALILVIPSLLFWHSGLLKEPLVFIGMGFFLYGLRNLGKKSVPVFVFAGIGLLLLINLKIFFGLTGVVVLILISWFRKRRGLRFNLVKYTTASVLILFVGLIYINSDSGRSALDTIAMKQHDFKNLASGGTYLKNDTAMAYVPYQAREKLLFVGDSVRIKPGSDFTYVTLPAKDTIHVSDYAENDLYSVTFDQDPSGSMVYIPDISENPFRVVPYALYNTVVEPLPIRGGVQIILAGLEHLVFILFILILMRYRKTVGPINWNLLMATLLFVAVIYLLIGATTPVLGAIVRYKTPLIPFVVYAACLYTDSNKVENIRLFRWIKQFVLR